MFDTIEQAHLNELHVTQDTATQLRAFIAIHNTRLGPALGGCRFIPYENETKALHDAIRLAQGMSYKAALAGLPLGGGKAVILHPKNLIDRTALLRKFGEFIESLGGRYITSVDSGTSPMDMDIVAHTTSYVTATSHRNKDPSPNTALGVFNGIKCAVSHQLQEDNLHNITICIQGLGHVGSILAMLLKKAGAKLIISDINPNRTKKIAKLYDAQIVAPEEIHKIPCDVFAPCAYGNIINETTVSELKCSIVAGAANNPVVSTAITSALHETGILYAPDYVINAGGLIMVGMEKLGYSAADIERKTLAIADTLESIFKCSQQTQESTDMIANAIAEKILYEKTTTTATVSHNYCIGMEANHLATGLRHQIPPTANRFLM